MLRYKTELAWFSRLVRLPARKWSGSILTTPEPMWGQEIELGAPTSLFRNKQTNGLL